MTDPATDLATGPADPQPRRASTLALIAAGGLGGLVLGLSGIASAQEAATPAPSPSQSQTAPDVDRAPVPGDRDCPEEDGGAAGTGTGVEEAPEAEATSPSV